MNAEAEVTTRPRPVRPLYWSLRRELWENRSIIIAPLVAAGLVVLALLLQSGAAHKGMPLIAKDSLVVGDVMIKLFGALVSPIVLTSMVVGLFYCLDALHGERRDRSILFWKSLPVSDLITVLSKALIPLLILPLLTLVLTVTAELIGLVAGSANLVAHGMSAAPLWQAVPLPRMALALAWGLTAMTLWYAPLYGWLLLVSGWARGSTFMWAVLMPLGVGLLERIVFRSSYLFELVGDRLFGWYRQSFSDEGAVPADPLSRITPSVLLTSPGLWIGLLFALALFAAAVWQRHRREPI